jgi:hypothetical protein
MMKKTFLLCCLLAVGLLCSCSMLKQNPAEREIERFHAEYNAGNYLKLYEEADDLVFKRSTSQTLFMDRLEKAKAKLGTVKRTKIVSRSSRNHDRGTDFYLTCDTEYTNGKAQEKFTYVSIGDKIFLEGYEVRY